MGFPFGGRRQNLLSYWVCEILKKFKSHLPHYHEQSKKLCFFLSTRIKGALVLERKSVF